MKLVSGLFDNAISANEALMALHEAGLDEDNIGVLATQTAYEAYLREIPEEEHQLKATTAGALAGGLVGLLAGLTAITVPGIGPIITTASLATFLGIAALGTGTGGLLGALLDLGFAEDEAEKYVESIRAGGYLVMVDAEAELVPAIENILEATDAVEVDVYDREKIKHLA